LYFSNYFNNFEFLNGKKIDSLGLFFPTKISDKVIFYIKILLDKVTPIKKVKYFQNFCLSTVSTDDFCLCWAANSLGIYFPAQNLNGLSIFPLSSRQATLIGILGSIGIYESYCSKKSGTRTVFHLWKDKNSVSLCSIIPIPIPIPIPITITITTNFPLPSIVELSLEEALTQPSVFSLTSSSVRKDLHLVESQVSFILKTSKIG
jgi:hypothetical protein